MQLQIFQIDAFTDHVFGGNPAAVIPLTEWISDDLMQQIAMENNLAETVFFVHLETTGNTSDFHIRWFTPLSEVTLCGHATLATAHYLFHHADFQKNEIRFDSLSGILTVTKEGDLYTFNFPADKLSKIEPPEILICSLNIQPQETYQGNIDLLCIFNSQEEIELLIPDFRKMKQLGVRGVICTAEGKESDFVSRYFAPAYGIDEDPVTGSAHTSLTPYWSNRLNKIVLSAVQLSKRRGHLLCKHLNDRVEISGKCVTYSEGEVII